MKTLFAWIKTLAARLRRFRWPLLVATIVAIAVGAIALRALSTRLEERFRATNDSIPTRVYSAVYWLRPGTGASAEELRFRFRERDYREVKPGEENRYEFRLASRDDRPGRRRR